MSTTEIENKEKTLLPNQENKNKGLESTIKSRNNNLKNDSKYKKLILPKIQKPRKTNMPVSTLNRNLKSSQSQNDLFSNQVYKNNLNDNNNEKEKLMIAKLSLRRLIAKINDINYSYKKLLNEKEENLNLLKQSISSTDYTYSENLYKKVEQVLEEAINNKSNNNYQNNNYESGISQNQEKESENKLNKENEKIENEENKKNEEIKENVINENNIENNNNEKNINENINNENNIENNNEKNINENINNENINENNNNENNNDEKKENEVEENKENLDEDNIDKNLNNEINGEINNENNDTSNQETKHKHNYSMETRGEDVNNNKINSFNNSRIINNNSNFNNSIEEENSIKEINDELNKYQIENGLFEKSVVSSKYYNILKAKTELSTLKHKMIKMKQIINQKEEEIDEIRNRAKMKNIIFQSGVLGRNMTELHKIKTRNKEIENISIPAKNLQYENLKKELEYYTKKNRSAMAESKDASENYFSIKNQFDEKTKLCNNLQGKNSNLKFKLNTLKQADFKKTMALKVLHQKLEQIPKIKETIESQKKMISEKENEINELKENLNKKNIEYEKSAENRNNGFEEMNKCERQLNSRISRQKNEYNKTKNEIRDIDKLLLKEIEVFESLNKNEPELVHQIYYKKGQSTNEFIEFLNEIEKMQEKKEETYKKECFKTYKIGNKFTYTAISKVKKENKKVEIKKDIKKSENEILPLLEDYLQY
jgi:hypothetical protein